MIDQIKIGKFIAAKRKEKSLTQAEVAEKLGITDRAVSKWERGLALPDASIMLNLCSILGISITELLTGEEAMEEDYKDKAEKLILEIRKKEEENNRYLLRLETVIGVLATVSCLTIIFTAAFLTPGTVLPHNHIYSGIPDSRNRTYVFPGFDCALDTLCRNLFCIEYRARCGILRMQIMPS